LQKYLENHNLRGVVLLTSVPACGVVPMGLRLFKASYYAAMHAQPKPVLLVATPALNDLFLNENTALMWLRSKANWCAIDAKLRLWWPLLNPQPSPMLVIAAEQDRSLRYRATGHRAEIWRRVPGGQGQAHNLMMGSGWRQVAGTGVWISKSWKDEWP
jgi:hypothetical protein